jgi:hypothetical protein
LSLGRLLELFSAYSTSGRTHCSLSIESSCSTLLDRADCSKWLPDKSSGASKINLHGQILSNTVMNNEIMGW